MASVFDVIFNNIADPRVNFVFPSEIAALVWARKICLHGAAAGVRSVAADRFLAWDRFKEETIRVREPDRKPVSSLIRRLFARSLARQNAAAPFLGAIIPAAFAENGGVFADSIAAMFSSLALWEELRERRSRDAPLREDDEDRDIRIIKERYAAFLDKHGLFEPAWEKAPFRGGDRRYIIFFPEVLADFDEYRELLEEQNEDGTANEDGAAVSFYTAEECAEPRGTPAEKPPLLFFDSARREIRSAVLELRRLHEEEGIPYEDMALTLADYKKIEPYVSRELFLHNIPFSRRAGKTLGEYPLGRIFSLVGQCAASLFSFDTLKPLLLDPAIPWKDMEKNRALIGFGIANHCVAPFKDRFRTVDPWEEGFRQNPNETLAAWYGELKQSLTALTGAKTFRDIKKRYYGFRSFLDMDLSGAENNAVLARCVEELSALVETEEDFPGLIEPPFSPFDFFTAHLREKNYVYVQEEGGVNLYDYPVAAGAPFRCHFVLNVSQAAAAIQHRPLAFLRQDKRAALGARDRDVSAAALALYSIGPWKDYACHTRLSVSEKTFAGPAIPHSAFAARISSGGDSGPENAAAPSADLYAAERRWRAGAAAKPPRLFSCQRRGFENWSGVLLDEAEHAAYAAAGGSNSAAADFSPAVMTLLRERIAAKNTGDGEASLSVSATDLNEFFACPRQWLFKRIFRLERHEEDAALLLEEQRGLIYHEILFRLFDRIKKQDRQFNPRRLSVYFGWIEELCDAVLRSSGSRGPLVYPLIAPLAAAMGRRLRALLKTEARYFPAYPVADLEKNYELVRGRLRLNGRIDRVSLSPEGPVIIDYKTGAYPAIKRCRNNQENGGVGLGDFQIPMYIKLYEAAGTKVNQACFVSINKRQFIFVMGKPEGIKIQKPCFRDDYESALAALDEGIGRFDRALETLDFEPQSVPGLALHKTCPSCPYKTICRSLYALNPRPGTEQITPNEGSEDENSEDEAGEP
ncbi:MAG: PD-(D/E)XK nuclease family protein [Treponema sp.]|jgi:hypothetical protein|nr:PD-(D/E)XK nuclease family protein [Treponema sp.]